MMMIDETPEDTMSTNHGTAPDYAAANGAPVTQRHADYCAMHGHAVWTQDGTDKGVCPRCGVVSPAPTGGGQVSANRANLLAFTMDDVRAWRDRHIGDTDPQADNNARASFAALALVTYTDKVGDSGELGTQISDLLGDLMHLCDSLGVEFDSAVDTARMHYTAEIRGEL